MRRVTSGVGGDPAAAAATGACRGGVLGRSMPSNESMNLCAGNAMRSLQKVGLSRRGQWGRVCVKSKVVGNIRHVKWWLSGVH